jgi:hypothetical protein
MSRNVQAITSGHEAGNGISILSFGKLLKKPIQYALMATWAVQTVADLARYLRC